MYTHIEDRDHVKFLREQALVAQGARVIHDLDGFWEVV